MTIACSSSDYLDVTYQPDLRILVGRWLRLVTEEEALRGYDCLLATARQYDAHYWLLDIRRRHRSAPAMLDWLLHTYYNQLVRELGPPVRLVYFMAPGLRQEFQHDNTVPEPHTYHADEPFRMNQCITEAEAVAWLLAEQRVHQA
ncbi:hypothetical protein GO988_19670 [Hymenobacter sp. HMF4947]|uniref:STAS/SEC14 domain-containing protein n=1 Tax=Hymenobacter ginkgonis TaxID=2682976 RepID=A0A7K1TJP1_9BACT|nr:hypothetical protein [Hymenobacter ginkgonis]MVN78556.1 hypothetical protein [Hymenobacter ginkgonis]